MNKQGNKQQASEDKPRWQAALKQIQIGCLTVLTILGALLAIAAYLLITQQEIWQSYVLEPFNAKLEIHLTEPQTMKGFNCMADVSSQVIYITGKTSISSEVGLTLDQVPLAQRQTDSSGKFQFEKVILHPGENQINVVATSLVGWKRLFADKYCTFVLKPNPPSVPVLSKTPSNVNKAALKLKGTADPKVKILFTISNSKLPNGKDLKILTTNTDETGQFQIDIKLPQPGNYTIVAQAKNAQGAISSSTQAISLSYDPTWQPLAAMPITRTVDAFISPTSLQFNLKATFLSDDPRVVGLVTGKQPLEMFVYSIFNLAIKQPNWIALNFKDVKPKIIISQHENFSNNPTITIELSKTFRKVLPWVGNQLSIAIPDYMYRRSSSMKPFLKEPNDTLILHFENYTANSYEPQPSILNNEVAIWKGNREDIDLSTGIVVKLTKPSLKRLSDILPLLQASPYDWLELFPFNSYFFSKLLSLAFSLLVIIPMLWMSRFFSRYRLLWIVPFLNRYQQIISINNHLTLELITKSPQVWALFFIQARNFYQKFEHITYTLISLCFIPVILNLEIQLGVFLGIAILIHWVIWLFRQREPSLFFQIIQGIWKAALLGFILLPFQGLRSIPFFNQVIATLIAIPFLRLLYILPTQLYNNQWGIRSLKLSEFRPILLLLLILIACPLDVSVIEQYFFASNNFFNFDLGYSNYITDFFYLFRDWLPYVLLFGIVLFLKQLEGKKELQKPIATIAEILFSCYLVGTTSNWLYIPIPFLLSLWTFPRFVMTSLEKQQNLEMIKNFVMSRRRSLLRRVMSKLDPDSFRNTLAQLEKKVIAGDLSLEEFDKRKAEIESYTMKYQHESRLLSYFRVADVVLRFGPCINNWQNGMWAVQHSWILIMPLLVIFVSGLQSTETEPHAYQLLKLSTQVGIFLCNWLVAAFFFGYFFPYIRGETGLKKGLAISLTIITCLLPIWLISLSNPTALVLQVGQYVFFFTTLGLWAFDYYTFRLALREEFSWRKFFQFTDLPNFTASASIILTSLSVAISTALTGQLSKVVGDIIQSSISLQQNYQQSHKDEKQRQESERSNSEVPSTTKNK